jgi:cytochrome c oxidase cbb3-type subunit 3
MEAGSKVIVIVVLCAVGFLEQGIAQAPPDDPAGRGRKVFGGNCGFCHGADARGTDQAPDLARSLLVAGDEKGKELGDFLKVGRTGKGMPVFPALTQPEIADLATFLHGRVDAARSQTIQMGANILVGDAKAGEVYFNGAGKCSSCHSAVGDLKGIGSKCDPVTLQDRFVNPRFACARPDGQGPVKPAQKPILVKVTIPSGQVISGTLVSVTDFQVTLRDATGSRRSFSRENDVPKVEINDPLQAHLDQLLKYTDKEMHDLTAYLVTLK